jgi:glycosyltransferase involved in cell wall biosynthesis
MRVALLHNHPIHYMHLLFTAIANQGVSLDVIFAARSSNQRSPSMLLTGENYHSHFLSEGSFESLPQLSSALHALRTIKQCSPDVVIISGYFYLPTWSILAWAKLHRKPIVFWFESNQFDRRRGGSKEMIKKLFVGACDAAHVYGSSNREYLESLGMKRSMIIEKRATIDSELFSKRRAAFHSEFRRFIYVGRFSPEKNLPRLLEAFRIVQRKHRTELVLVGYGPDEQLLRQQARDLGLNDSVVFAGAMTQDEVGRALADSDCLVLPSLSEPWGLVANEALCSGIPIIVSNRCGCARDLVTEDSGWAIEPEDLEQLAEAMYKLCMLPLGRLKQMGEAALKIASEYTPEKGADRIVANLEELLERDRPENRR